MHTQPLYSLRQKSFYTKSWLLDSVCVCRDVRMRDILREKQTWKCRELLLSRCFHHLNPVFKTVCLTSLWAQHTGGFSQRALLLGNKISPSNFFSYMRKEKKCLHFYIFRQCVRRGYRGIIIDEGKKCKRPVRT